jgi:hypothetical protein
MHAIQEELETIDTLEDDAVVEMVLASWKTVCEENDIQRHLVNESQWSQWISYKERTLKMLESAVDGYKVGALTPAGRETFVTIAKEITRAGHKTAPELMEEARSAVAAAIIPALAAQTNVAAQSDERKGKWKGLIRKMLGR